VPELRGRLALESGAIFEGILFGAPVAHAQNGEVVFNTCMSGYQEVISDPSYAGQVVVMTYPLIGNYGCRDDTAESFRVHCRALVVREQPMSDLRRGKLVERKHELVGYELEAQQDVWGKDANTRLSAAIDECSPALIVLAGFMRILSPEFVNRYAGRILNRQLRACPAI